MSLYHSTLGREWWCHIASVTSLSLTHLLMSYVSYLVKISLRHHGCFSRCAVAICRGKYGRDLYVVSAVAAVVNCVTVVATMLLLFLLLLNILFWL